MSWLKVDDGEWMAPWVDFAGNEAYGVYTRLASYCAQYLTDGVVPQRIAQSIAAGTDALDRLERAGRIRVEEFGTITLPEYLETNPSRAQVEADRQQRSLRGRRAAQARWGTESEDGPRPSRVPPRVVAT